MDKNFFAKQVQASILGFSVGDALGVPVEFSARERRVQDPVREMRGDGAHGQFAGTWSDDTSMTLCEMHSILHNGLDYHDQMQRFVDWLENAAYTAHDEVFDVGITTRNAIFHFVQGRPAAECGEASEYSCGNGSLMRMLPIAFYIIGAYGNNSLDDKAADIIHTASSCTHAHKKCQMACGIYCDVVFHICAKAEDAVHEGIRDALSYYKKRSDFADIYPVFEELASVGQWQEDAVDSTGYVVHTLQAALWCLLTTDSYAECVLKAVNLGEDTDTTAAVAGGLAGLLYHKEQIPADWLAVLAKLDEISTLSERFAYACVDKK